MTRFFGGTWNATRETWSAVLCNAEETIGGQLFLDTRGKADPSETDDICGRRDFAARAVHPPLEFRGDSSSTHPGLIAAQKFTRIGDSTGTVPLLKVAPELSGAAVLEKRMIPCESAEAVDGADGNIFIQVAGSWWRYDPRIMSVTNTLDSPASSDGNEVRGGGCPNVPRTFLNHDSCVRHRPVDGKAACSPSSYSDSPITLDTPTLRRWYTGSGKYVYTMRGLVTAVRTYFFDAHHSFSQPLPFRCCWHRVSNPRAHRYLYIMALHHRFH